MKNQTQICDCCNKVVAKTRAIKNYAICNDCNSDLLKNKSIKLIDGATLRIKQPRKTLFDKIKQTQLLTDMTNVSKFGFNPSF